MIVDQINPADPREVVVAAARGDGSDAEVAVERLTDDTMETLRLLASDDTSRDDERAAILPDHLADFKRLLPAGLRRRLSAADCRDVLIVPTGLLWAVPWSGVPIDGDRLLVEAASLTVTPSLRVHALARAACQRRSPGRCSRGRAGSTTSPVVCQSSTCSPRSGSRL